MDPRQFLSLLVNMSIDQFASKPEGGRAALPYPLATTKAERMAHVARRQAKNKAKRGPRAYRDYIARVRKSEGPNRTRTVDRFDGRSV